MIKSSECYIVFSFDLSSTIPTIPTILTVVVFVLIFVFVLNNVFTFKTEFENLPTFDFRFTQQLRIL